MSQPKPQADLSYLNSFLSKVGSKSMVNSEFVKAKLFNIIKKMSESDHLQAQVAKAHVESYFGNTSNCIKILENTLKITNYEYLLPWSRLIDTYIQSGDLENLKATFNRILELGVILDKQCSFKLIHVIDVYILTELLEKFKVEELQENHIVGIQNNFQSLVELGISVEIYRSFISKIYKLFYTKFSGSIQISLFFNDCELVLRVCSTVDDADELFALNNKFNDEILDWYEKSTDLEREQIEKVTVYFKHKVFQSNGQWWLV